MPKALVTGVAGQDGILLTNFLLNLGYEVFGLTNRRQQELIELGILRNPNFRLVNGDLRDFESLLNAIKMARPDEIYNLGAISSVSKSFSEPELTHDVNALGPVRLIEAVLKSNHLAPRIFQASSSEQFGNSEVSPQNESTPFKPISPYAYSKTSAHEACLEFREKYSLHVSCGILFNHESSLRPKSFVTRKITSTVAKISLGKASEIQLGNLDSRRDWGYAPDYVRAMWMMLQNEKPEDFIIATGKSHTLRDFLDIAFKQVGMEGKTDVYLRQNQSFFRVNEVHHTVGDPSKICEKLSWENSVPLESIIKIMIENDLLLEE